MAADYPAEARTSRVECGFEPLRIRARGSQTMTGEETAQACARFADDKKAEDIIILDVRGLSPVSDYFVIATASSTPHMRSVQRGVDEGMKDDLGVDPHWRDEAYESGWVVIDYLDTLVHIMTAEKREFYALEELWGDAARIEPKLERRELQTV
jgi:ribosome-associated protein